MPKKSWTTEIILGVLILIGIAAIIAVTIGGGNEQAAVDYRIIQSTEIYSSSFY